MVNKTANIEIKKIKLMQKQEKEKKKIVMCEKDKKISISTIKKKMEKTLFDYDNFEIAGW